LGDCAAIRDCVVSSNCFQLPDSLPHGCYCGEGVDINLCWVGSFVPTGGCADEIAAAFPLGSSNQDILTDMAKPNANASGAALNILINSAQLGICVAECTLVQ